MDICKHKEKIIEDTLRKDKDWLYGYFYTQIYITQCEVCGRLFYQSHPLGKDFDQNKKGQLTK
jgi:hypothetical protein